VKLVITPDYLQEIVEMDAKLGRSMLRPYQDGTRIYKFRWLYFSCGVYVERVELPASFSQTPGIAVAHTGQRPCLSRFSVTSCQERRMSNEPQLGQLVCAPSL